MKKATTILSTLMLFVLLGANNPVVAQTSDATRNTTEMTTNDDHDDSGKWGLAGLLGLLGLAGLRRRDDDKVRSTTNVNR